jgi:hypothetical protein
MLRAAAVREERLLTIVLTIAIAVGGRRITPRREWSQLLVAGIELVHEESLLERR